jgi:Mg2+-importing ATPase
VSRLLPTKTTVNSDLLKRVAEAAHSEAFTILRTSPYGLTVAEADERAAEVGRNEVAREKPPKWYAQMAEAFSSPFNGLLVVLGAVSYFTDVRMASPGKGDWTKVILLTLMISLSGLMKFWQEFRSMKAAEQLKAMVRTTATVLRRPDDPGFQFDPSQPPTQDHVVKHRREIPLADLVPGDIVFLSAGDMIPADLRVLTSKDLFVSQSALTGESLPVEKYDRPAYPVGNSAASQRGAPSVVPVNGSAANRRAANGAAKIGQSRKAGGDVLDASALCFMGTNIVSGSAMGVVVNTGDRTFFGSMASSILGHRARTSFDEGVRKVSWVLIRFTLFMVPAVFLINGITKRNWTEALLFALAVAVGVTPELLPMVVSANLAKGSIKMAKYKVIVKRLNSIQNFGAMDILCTDKTGTLTQDRVVLERHLDVTGEESYQVLRLAFLNSYHQTGLKNLLDVAIVNHAEVDNEEPVLIQYLKIDEIPFDFMRRRMSVIVQDGGGRHLLICKGAVEEIFDVCDRVQIGGELLPFDPQHRENVVRVTNDMNEDGMRVVAVAYKYIEDKALQKETYTVADEKDLVLAGYIEFLDPPKETAGEAVKALDEYGVDVKILTGDNELVAKKTCRDVGIDVRDVLLGNQIEAMTDEELADAADKITVFAKLNPLHKSRVILALRKKGHTVGYMGDGINDAPALRDADVGISVDTAVDIAKESADIILLEKSLTVLKEGVVQGRAVFGNIIKYIKMAASSNFGNMFSVLPASAFLPFLPMLPIQILILNTIYDLSQLSLPWDNMDEEFLRKPRKWDASGLSRFMLYIGPCSSVYDLTTYYLMWFVFKGWVVGPGGVFVNAGLFQAGWFVESMMSQTLIIHMIRTRKIPFIQSTATLPVVLVTSLAIATVCLIPFTALGATIGFQPLPATYWPYLAAMIVCYLIQTQMVKVFYMKKFGGEWL